MAPTEHRTEHELSLHEAARSASHAALRASYGSVMLCSVTARADASSFDFIAGADRMPALQGLGRAPCGGRGLEDPSRNGTAVCALKSKADRMLSRSSQDAWLQQVFGANPAPGGLRHSEVGSDLPAPILDPGGASATQLKVSWNMATLPPADLELRYQHVGAGGSVQSIHMGIVTTFRHTLCSLDPNCEYAIRAAPASGSGAESAELRATTLPGLPHGLVCSGSTGSSLDLSWECAGAARYVVYGSAALRFAKVYSGQERRCRVEGLTVGCEYGFRVCAFNAAGGSSAFSEEVLAVCMAGGQPFGAGDVRDDRPAMAAAEQPVCEYDPGLRRPEPFAEPQGVDVGPNEISAWDQTHDADQISSFPPPAGGMLDAAIVVPSLPARAASTPRSLTPPPLTPQLLTLGHDSLSMSWPAATNGLVGQFVVELAESSSGRMSADADWTRIYEGATPKCEVSFLTPQTTYSLRIALIDRAGAQRPWGPTLSLTTAAQPPPPRLAQRAAPTQATAASAPHTPRKQASVIGRPSASTAEPPSAAAHSGSSRKAASTPLAMAGRVGLGQAPKSPNQPSSLSLSRPASVWSSRRQGTPSTAGECQPTSQPSPHGQPDRCRQPIHHSQPSPRSQPSPNGQPSPRRSVVRPASCQPPPTLRHNSPRCSPPHRAPHPPRQSSPLRPSSAPSRFRARAVDAPVSPWVAPAAASSESSSAPSPAPSSAGAVHGRLHALHAAKLQARRATRQHLHEQRAALANSPRGARAASAPDRPTHRPPTSAFGSNAPRGELWSVVGCLSCAGSCTSPLGSACHPSTAGQAGPGPGAYETSSVFQSEEQMRGSVRGGAASGAAAAFKSKSVRPSAGPSAGGAGPGPGEYDVMDGKGITDKATALAKEAALRSQRTAAGDRPSSAGGRGCARADCGTPGPGAYAPHYAEEHRVSVHCSMPSAIFLSGSRRIGLPWAGGAEQSPEVDGPSPGPGAYDTRGGTPRSARRTPAACFGSTTTPRFGHEPDPDDLPPPPGAYFCSY